MNIGALGSRYRFDSPGGQFHLDLSGRTNWSLQPGNFKDRLDLDGLKNAGPMWESNTVVADLKTDFGSVGFGTRLTYDQSAIGQRGRLDLSLQVPYCNLSAWTSGRLTDDSSLLKDQSLRRVGLDAQCRNGDFAFNLTGSSPIEGEHPFQELEVGAGFKWDFGPHSQAGSR